jgi:two-component system nitrate/nitrite response regulator NarL
MQTTPAVIQPENLAQQDIWLRAKARFAIKSGPLRTRVLVAHRHPLYREAVTRAIKHRPELELVAVAEDGRQALDSISAEAPDVALIDRELDELSAEQVLNAVGRDGIETRILLIAADPEPELVYAAIANGAAGYLTKDADAKELCEAIGAVGRGSTVLAPQLQAGIASEIRLRSERDGRPFLSQRESEVLKLVAAGLTAPEIARRIHLSPATVKSHLQSLYQKLDVRERAAAVAVAMRRGLVE